MEDWPHYLGVVDFAEMVLDIQAEDYVIQSRVLNFDAIVPQRRWQLPQKVWEPNRSHIFLTHRVELRPCILKRLEILLLERMNIIFIFFGLILIEVLINDRNKDIHEYEEGCKLKEDPEYDCDASFLLKAFVHHAIPRLAC